MGTQLNGTSDQRTTRRSGGRVIRQLLVTAALVVGAVVVLTGPAAAQDATPVPPTSCAFTFDGNVGQVAITPAPNDNADRYLLYRRVNNRTRSWVASIPAADAAEGFVFDLGAGPGPGDTYSYYATTKGINGDFIYDRRCSGEITGGPALPGPIRPQTCRANINGSVANVTFTPAANDNADRYLLYRIEDFGPPIWTGSIAAADAANGFTYDLDPDIEYRFNVQTKGTDGTFSLNAACGLVFGPPMVDPPSASDPVRPAACSTAVTGSVASITFTPAANDNADRYLLYRYEDGGPALWTASIAAADAADGFDLDLDAGVVYRLGVKTKGTDGTFTFLRNCGTVQGPTVVPPADTKPPASCATQITGSMVTVSFTPATNDNADRYLLYRYENGGPALWTASIAAANAADGFDVTIDPNVSYEFAVKTKGADGVYTRLEDCPDV